MSDRGVRRAIKELRDQLKDDGILRVKRRFNKSNEYYFDFNEDKSVLIEQDLMRTDLVANEDKSVLINEDKSGLLTLESNTGINSLCERKKFPLHKNMDSSRPEANNPFTHEADDSSLHKDEELAAFERFWEAYPRRVGRNESLDEFAAAVKGGADPELIIKSAARYAQARKQKRQPEYDKYPVNWLRGEHWNDELPPTCDELLAAAMKPSKSSTRRCYECDKVVVTDSEEYPFYCDDCQSDLNEFAQEIMEHCK
jgi:hypothetical protein